MDSRRFGVLLVAIFLIAFAPFGQTQVVNETIVAHQTNLALNANATSTTLVTNVTDSGLNATSESKLTKSISDDGNGTTSGSAMAPAAAVGAGAILASAPANTTTNTSSALASVPTLAPAPAAATTTTLAPAAATTTTLAPAAATTTTLAPATATTTTLAPATLAATNTSSALASVPAVKPAAAATSNVSDATTASPINSQGIRDVLNCTAVYQEMMGQTKSIWNPEALMLDGTELAGTSLSHFCTNIKNNMAMQLKCVNETHDPKTAEIAPVVDVLGDLFRSVCSNPQLTLPATTANPTVCSEHLRQVTKGCATSSTDSAKDSRVVYPTGLLYQEIVANNCSKLNATQSCIVNGLAQHQNETSACSQEMLKAVSLIIADMTKNVKCVTGVPASAPEQPTTVKAPEQPTTIKAPEQATTKTPAKAPGSSATNVKVNFVALIPILLVLFKFY